MFKRAETNARGLTRLAFLAGIALLALTALPIVQAQPLLDVPFDLPLQTFDANTTPAGWSVVNNTGTDGWRFDNPANRANGTGGAGNFAIADSINAGAVAMDTELRTPTLNLAGTTKVTLTFKATLASTQQSNEKAEVDVSLNGGGAWTNVWQGEAGQNYGLVNVDLTPQAANQGSVIVRFHYYQANQAGYWGLDDVQIAARPPGAPTGLTAAAVPTQNVINLAWTRSGMGEDSFTIQRSADGTTGWTTIATTKAGVTTYVDPNLTCNTRYFYQVNASNAFGASAYSGAANAITKDCSTPVIEINQGLGQNSGRYVAGKDTAILIYLANPLPVDPNQQTAAITRDGNAVATLTPQPSANATATLIFTCPTRAACGDWQAGTYSFDVTINGTASNLGNIKLQDRLPLRVLAVPLKANYGGNIQSVPNDTWKNSGDFIKSIYPVSLANFKWTTGPELDVSALDITTDAGQRGVWQALANLQPMTCANNKAAANCYDKIIGFAPMGITNGDGSTTNGYTYGDPANVVGMVPGFSRTNAHEVGHTYGLGDEYNALGGFFRCDVNPTPPNYVGKDWYNRATTNFSCVNSTTQGFDNGGSTGVRVNAGQAHPFEIAGRGLIATDLGNFMGNYSDVNAAWISPDAWRQIFDQSAPQPGPPGPTPGRPKRPQAAPYRVVEASGFISLTGQVTLQPWYSFTTTEVIQPVSSPYQIQAVNALSKTLASQGLPLDFYVFDRPLISAAPFDELVAFPPNTAAFRIISGTTVLRVVPVSPNAPTVSVTAPTAGSTVNGNSAITWNASDPDGGSLYFTVEYNHSANPNGWITLASNITGTQWMEDYNQLPGGGTNQSQVRVTATDGVNATAAVSGGFTVAGKPPEVFIDNPSPGEHFKPGLEVTLEGEAFDDQDGIIESDSQLVWTSNRVEGTLGTGPTVTLSKLPVGQHVITLSATNSLSMTAVASITITIDPYQLEMPVIGR